MRGFRFATLMAVLIACFFSVTIPAAESEPEAETPKVAVLTDIDRAAVEKTIREYFAAYVAKDLEAAMAHWAEDSADRAERRELLAELFQAVESIELKSLEFRSVQLVDQRVRVKVFVELVGLDRRTGQPSASLGKLRRNIDLVQRPTGFQISQYFAPAEDPALLETISASRSHQELIRIVKSEFDDETDQLGIIMLAFVNHADAEQRQRLLRNDQLGHIGVLTRVQFVVHLNFRSWSSLVAFMAGQTNQLLDAERFNLRATEVAEFMDDPEAIAWCRLHRALVLQAHDQVSEARVATRAALAEFEHRDHVEGQAAAQAVLGRLAAAAGDKIEALVAFKAADELFSGVVILQDSYRQTLGEYWSRQRNEADRLSDAYNDARDGADWDAAAQHQIKFIALEREIYGPWHKELMEGWLRLGYTAEYRGDPAAALPYFQSALKVAERLYEKQSTEYRDCQDELDFARERSKLDKSQRDQYLSGIRAAAMALTRRSERKYDEALENWD